MISMKHMAPAPSRKIYGAERGARWVIACMVVLIVAQLAGVAVPGECWLILAGGLVALFPAQVVGQGVTDARAAKQAAPEQ